MPLNKETDTDFIKMYHISRLYFCLFFYLFLIIKTTECFLAWITEILLTIQDLFIFLVTFLRFELIV